MTTRNGHHRRRATFRQMPGANPRAGATVPGPTGSALERFEAQAWGPGSDRHAVTLRRGMAWFYVGEDCETLFTQAYELDDETGAARTYGPVTQVTESERSTTA